MEHKKIDTVGIIPPQAIELEEAVLGAILLESKALGLVEEFLKSEMFYSEKHKYIFEAIIRLSLNSRSIDLITVTEELRNMGKLEQCGGAYRIVYLTSKIASTAHIETHSRIIQEKWISREIGLIGAEMHRKSFKDDEDPFDTISIAESKIMALTQGKGKKEAKINTIWDNVIKDSEKAAKNESGLTGVPSGLNTVDKVTGGWQKSDLVILAARPGMGKTAFILSIARNASMDFKKPVAIFSLEMSKEQLVLRLISGEIEVPSEQIRRGHLENYHLEQAKYRRKEIEKTPLYIDDTPSLSILEFRAKARRMVKEHKIELIIIDYLQLMVAGKEFKGNREGEISYISRNLKAIAKELEVPIIALSQLSREVEKRTDKRPMLSDLRESGAIEQDADMVMFIYRPEYYGIEQTEQGESTRGVAEILFAKNRNGQLDIAVCNFIGKYTKFTNHYMIDTSSIKPSQEF